MSDEPLYCVACGMEIGCGCECGFDHLNEVPPPRPYRFCEVCGVIPKVGGECPFYMARGPAKKGCET